jgi:YndJ-like protein
MKSTVKKAAPLAINPSESAASWARLCALLGAAVWAGIAVLARTGAAPIGSIELIFLFAPLVIVPLGIELDRVIAASGPLPSIAARIQPFCAALAVIALWLPPGRSAGILASGSMVACLLLTAPALPQFWPSSFSASAGTLRWILAIARLDLAIGGAWFVASRFGVHPLGTQEPIVLLTAVHFHFAGFATAMIAAAMLRFTKEQGTNRWLPPLLPFVAGMPFLVAAGFVISPTLKMAAAVAFSASVAALAIILRSLASRTESRTARVLLNLAAASVFAGMVLSSIYAIADFRGSDVLPIPQMARTHGVLNAVGFCLPALLGWLVEFAPNALSLE